MNPVHQGVGGAVMEEKCDVAVVAVVVGGDDSKHKILLKNVDVTVIFLSFWCCCVILYQVKCCNLKMVKMVKSAGSEKVNQEATHPLISI